MKKYLILLCALLLLGTSAIGCSSEGHSDIHDVDVDLTLLSATVLQAEFENIISNSENYLGQTIRVIGTYNPLFYEQTGNYYHYVIVVSGDSCCQMGFEFKRADNYKVPDDYPERNARIEVIGTLDRYTEQGTSYLYLDVIEMNILGN